MAKVLEQRDGIEVSVETGVGHLLKVDEPKGRNARVEINADHLGQPVVGWVDTADSALYAFARAACAEGYRVEYRVVVHRKRDVDPALPLESIPSTERFRELEWLDRAGGIVAGALTSAERASSAAPAPPAPAPTNGAPAAPGAPALVCGLCDGSLTDGSPVRTVEGVRQHVECPPQGTDPATPPPRPPDAGQADRPAGPRIAEARPWEFYNSDNSLNPGSYAYGAAEGMVLLANDLLLARAKTAADAGGEFVAPSAGQIRSLSVRLIRAADRAQAALRDDGHVSRMAASHSRCRAAVRASLAVYPVPWGRPADYDQWELDLAAHAGILLALTVELVEGE